MILSNQVRCKSCQSTPFSSHRHHFQPCDCGSISVDGGMDYLRRVGKIDNYDELSIEIPNEAVDAAKEKIRWALDTGRNELGILCAVAIALRDSGVKLTTS